MLCACCLCSALREVGLNFYDHRAVAVEVVARLDQLCAAAARREPLYVRQLLALEALQVGVSESGPGVLHDGFARTHMGEHQCVVVD